MVLSFKLASPVTKPSRDMCINEIIFLIILMVIVVYDLLLSFFTMTVYGSFSVHDAQLFEVALASKNYHLD